MSEEIAIDQAVYDSLTAGGMSERMARAKAKAATVRAEKKAKGETLGAVAIEKNAENLASFKEKLATVGGGGGGGVALSDAPTGRLTPEERAARVAASLGRGIESPSIGVPAESKHTHRMLALIPPTGIQQVQDKQQDKVYTWPHLLIVEFVCLLAVGCVLLVVSYFIDATFGQLANPNLTPNPSKAPWYFLGLQELLRYFHPMVAGVTLPTVVLVILMGLGYYDKNPSAKPENRKFANMAWTFHMAMWTMLVMAGSFFRGPGFNWVWPWVDGLFFEL